MDALREVLMRPTVENSLSTLQEVMGRVMMTRRSLLKFGKMSDAQLSNTSIRDGKFLFLGYFPIQLLIEYS